MWFVLIIFKLIRNQWFYTIFKLEINNIMSENNENNFNELFSFPKKHSSHKLWLQVHKLARYLSFPSGKPNVPCLAIFHRGHRNISAIGVYSLKKLIPQHATSQARVANSFGLVLFMLPLSSLPFSPFVSYSTCFQPLETGRLLSSTD